MSDTRGDKGRKQLLLRLAPSLHRELMAWAQEDFRSLNSQIEFLLTECVRARRKRERDDLTPGADPET